jgi:ribonucleoside-diphosphate reductase alpha chain
VAHLPERGRINASNPCSEYMFLDNTACNLASLNIMKFYDAKTAGVRRRAVRARVDLWTMVLEISVLMAAFPSKRDRRAELEVPHAGPGLRQPRRDADAGGHPVRQRRGPRDLRVPDRDPDRASLPQSAELAGEHGPFAGYADDKENMLRVIRNHRLAAHGEERDSARSTRTSASARCRSTTA